MVGQHKCGRQHLPGEFTRQVRRDTVPFWTDASFIHLIEDIGDGPCTAGCTKRYHFPPLPRRSLIHVASRLQAHPRALQKQEIAVHSSLKRARSTLQPSTQIQPAPKAQVYMGGYQRLVASSPDLLRWCSHCLHVFVFSRLSGSALA